MVATTVTDTDGNYLFEGLVPASYVVEFFNESGVFIGSKQTLEPLVSGQTVLLPLPVDPGGVVYDSIARVPVGGVMLNLVNASGELVDELCLREMQQGQVTTEDGLYAFDVLPGADASCGLQKCIELKLHRYLMRFDPTSLRSFGRKVLRVAVVPRSAVLCQAPLMLIRLNHFVPWIR